MIDFISALVAALVALGGLFAWRSEQLRRDEVLEWGMKCVDALQRLHILCLEAGSNISSDQTREVSVLAEQGRMFFRNASPEEYGQDKEPAYRGYRPLILDQLVFSYLVAENWNAMSPSDRAAGSKVVTRCKERFVGLLQREVGRKRTADRYNREPGTGYDLPALLSLERLGRGPILPPEENGLLVQVRRLLRR